MSTSAEQMRQYSGPAILSFGFRPLFLSAGVVATLVMGLWTLMLSDAVQLPTAFAPVDWHAHELLYGYLPAVVAGFLLTAIPNWTGRLPIAGQPLLFLVLCWWAGRAAIIFSGQIGAFVSAIIDLAFLATLGVLVCREIIAGRNWRNLAVLIPVTLLLFGNALFHAEAAAGSASNGYGARTGIAAAIVLIMLIGGRIIPSFTRNWLARRQPGEMPTPFSRFDRVALGCGSVALASWIVVPETLITAVLCLVAGLVHAWRLVRWMPHRTLAEPLVWILHAGYAFLPLGFMLIAASRLTDGIIQPSAALHAWTAGSIGVMTLAVMTRASLGHVGRALQATPAVTAIYGSALASAMIRILAGTGIASPQMFHLAAGLWVAAFAGFVFIFAPLLCRPRQ